MSAFNIFAPQARGPAQPGQTRRSWLAGAAASGEYDAGNSRLRVRVGHVPQILVEIVLREFRSQGATLTLDQGGADLDGALELWLTVDEWRPPAPAEVDWVAFWSGFFSLAVRVRLAARGEVYVLVPSDALGRVDVLDGLRTLDITDWEEDRDGLVLRPSAIRGRPPFHCVIREVMLEAAELQAYLFSLRADEPQH